MRRAEPTSPGNTDMPGYVEVTAESLHKEVYAGPYFRAYRVLLSPGQATDYHRHSEDTLYVVIKGGTMRTISFKGERRGPMVFPRSFSLYRKLWLALQNGATGSGYLPDGLSFFMPTRKYPAIHRAVASPHNRSEVYLMGIEIRCGSASRPAPAYAALPWKSEYHHASFGAFALALVPAAVDRIAMPGRHLFAVCTRGLLEIAPERACQENRDPRRLSAGDYLCFSGDSPALARNASGATAELLVIAVPAGTANSRIGS